MLQCVLFIADTNNHRIRLLDLNSSLIQTVAGTGMGEFDGEEGGAIAVSLNAPHGLALSPTGNLLIADAANHRIRELSVLFQLAFALPAVPQQKPSISMPTGRSTSTIFESLSMLLTLRICALTSMPMVGLDSAIFCTLPGFMSEKYPQMTQMIADER